MNICHWINRFRSLQTNRGKKPFERKYAIRVTGDIIPAVNPI